MAHQAAIIECSPCGKSVTTPFALDTSPEILGQMTRRYLSEKGWTWGMDGNATCVACLRTAKLRALTST